MLAFVPNYTLDVTEYPNTTGQNSDYASASIKKYTNVLIKAADLSEIDSLCLLPTWVKIDFKSSLVGEAWENISVLPYLRFKAWWYIWPACQVEILFAMRQDICIIL